MYPFKTADMSPNFAFALSKAAAATVEQSLPHLRSDFPQFENFTFSARADDRLALITMEFKVGGMPTGGEMPPAEFEQLKAAVSTNRTYLALKGVTALQGKFGWSKFLLALDVNQGAFDWHFAQQELLSWLSDEPLERANRLNVARVEAAIPKPPQYSLNRVQSAMWVLECEETMVQGTAFDLEGYGVVTNQHVVHNTSAMRAFAQRHQVPSQGHS